MATKCIPGCLAGRLTVQTRQWMIYSFFIVPSYCFLQVGLSLRRRFREFIVLAMSCRNFFEDFFTLFDLFAAFLKPPDLSQQLTPACESPVDIASVRESLCQRHRRRAARS